MKSVLAAAIALFSPVVHPDRSVTFKLTAPQAAKVSVECSNLGKHAMIKGEDGVWTYHSPVMEADIYTYTFKVDGKTSVDPSNPEQKTSYFGNDSLLFIPGNQLWDPREVPHGVLHHHPYHSAIANHDRELIVYTPPRYEAKSDQPLPVLYLLHGYSDGADGWTQIGRAQVILDNLLADKKIVPMVVVMPLGYGDMAVVANGWEGRNRDNAWDKSLAAFDKTLIREVLPLAEANYHLRKDAGGRALAGLSMGGTQSIQGALAHPDVFGWIGAFSSGGMPDDFNKAYPEASDSLNERLKLLWIACGKQDGLIGPNRKLVAWLDHKKIRHQWTETEGSHAWPVWRRNLTTFAPLLFRD